jgi:acetyl esterase/lipase
VRTFIRVTLIALTLLLLSLGGIYFYSPPKALDVINALYPGDGGVVRVADDVPFREGERGRLDVYAKPQAAGARRPVLVFFYGGGWAMGQRREYSFVAKAYAARGYVVVIPDYRLVPEVRFPSFIEDGAAAVRWTRDNIARFGGDPDRIVLAGHSAGAYIAVMLALDRRYLAAAGVDPGAVKAAAGLAGPYDFYPFVKKRSIDAMSRAPDPQATQPINFARADAPPLWLANGTIDTVVRPRNAVRLAARQKQLGSRTTVLRLYEGRNHNDLIIAISKPFRRREPVLAESLAFFEVSLNQRAARSTK